jgi:hypothetical protein
MGYELVWARVWAGFEDVTAHGPDWAAHQYSWPVRDLDHPIDTGIAFFYEAIGWFEILRYRINSNDTKLSQSWQIFLDPMAFAFDGLPLPPMHRLSATPTMLRTQRLGNPPQQSATILKRSTTNVALPIYWRNVAATTTLGAMLGSVFLI